MADKYVIQIAKEGGANSMDGNKIANKDTDNQTNFDLEYTEISKNNFEDIIKKIQNHLKEEKYKDFQNLLDDDKKIILKDVGKHCRNEIFLFSAKSNCIDWESLFSAIKIRSGNEKSINKIIEDFKEKNSDNNFIRWNEFCHIEGADQDNFPFIIDNERNDMNRLYITDETFNKDNDELCFININKYTKKRKDIFNYEEVHECKDETESNY